MSRRNLFLFLLSGITLGCFIFLEPSLTYRILGTAATGLSLLEWRSSGSSRLIRLTLLFLLAASGLYAFIYEVPHLLIAAILLGLSLLLFEGEGDNRRFALAGGFAFTEAVFVLSLLPVALFLRAAFSVLAGNAAFELLLPSRTWSDRRPYAMLFLILLTLLLTEWAFLPSA